MAKRSRPTCRELTEKPGPNEVGPAEIDEAMPAPLLMNCWKHHARTIQARIAATVAGGEEAVRALPRKLLLIGDGLMDLYLGSHSPESIARETLEILEAEMITSPPAYSEWVVAAGGYRTIELSDSSQWVLRWAPVAGRHIHIHPARYSPHSVRVRANLLRSAIGTLVWAGLHRMDPLADATINQARVALLGLSPLRSTRPDKGLGELLRRLRTARE